MVKPWPLLTTRVGADVTVKLAPSREPWQEVVCEFTQSGVCAANCAEACVCIRKIGLPTFDTLEERRQARGSTLAERLDDGDVWP